jgi:hypothetical protein
MKINYLPLMSLSLMIGTMCVFTNAYGSKYDTKVKNQQERYHMKHLEKQESKIVRKFKYRQNIKWDSPTAQIFALLLTSAMVVGAEPMTKTNVSASDIPLPQPLDSNQLLLINHTVSSNVSDCAAAHFMTEALKTTAGSNSPTPSDYNLPAATDIGDTLHDSFTRVIKDLQTHTYDKLTRKKQLAIANKIPTLGAQTIDSLYTDIKKIGAGSANIIYEAKLKHARGPLKKGTKIAIRVGITNPNFKNISRQIKNYAALVCIKDAGISDYIPPIYAAYYGPRRSDLEPNGKHDNALYTEMALIEGMGYDEKYGGGYYSHKNMMEPRVVFEQYLGRWAVAKVAEQCIDDPDGDVLRHHMVEFDDHYAIYHINDKSYLFSPGNTAKQVDYDDGRACPSQGVFFHNCIWAGLEVDSYYMERTSKDCQAFMKDICAKHGLFQSIHANFQAFLVTEDNPIPDTHKIRHYYIDTERYQSSDQ